MWGYDFKKKIDDCVHLKDQLKAKLPTLKNISYTRMASCGTVFFNEELSECEEDLLKRSIECYINPIVIEPIGCETILSATVQTFDSEAYNDICCLILNPQKQKLLKFIIACSLEDSEPSQKDDPDFWYDVIVYDHTTYSIISSYSWNNYKEKVFELEMPEHPYIGIRNLKIKCRKRNAKIGQNIKVNYVSYVFI